MHSLNPWRATLQSISEVCDVETVAAPGANPEAPPGLLIEVPHGATRRRHFEATRRRLIGEFPDDLEDFFYVNTDVGSIECARFIARMIVSPGEYPEVEALAQRTDSGHRRPIDSVLIVRGLVARTFIDLNRVIGTSTAAGTASGTSRATVTPGLPTYVTQSDDIESLLGMHRAYQTLAARAYGLVCGTADSVSSEPAALILHTYAPRTVAIDRVDEDIVAALRRAYEPTVFATLPRRPEVDLITETVAGERLAPEALVRAVRQGYAEIGIEVAENATYRLDESTMGYVHSANYPQRVLCAEINRELLADPFTPFAEMSISESKARRMAAPIAAAFLRDSRA